MIKQRPLGKPFIDDMVSITYEVTYLCDKRCSYCYNPKQRCEGASTEVKDRIWNKIMSLDRPLQVLLLGGETTMFEHSIDYWNEYVEKYKDDETKYMTFFTHGNNKPEVYQRFKGGKLHAHVGMSYHAGQTDYELWISNIKILLGNNVPVVVCMVISEDKEHWAEKLKVLEEVAELGCRTDVCFEVSPVENTQQVPPETFDYFYVYFFRCIKIWELEFSGDEELTIRRDYYFQHFPRGLSEVKKMCKNKVFKIEPNGNLVLECGQAPHVLNLNINLHDMEKFLDGCTVMCNKPCTGIASTMNVKHFFTDKIEDIK